MHLVTNVHGCEQDPGARYALISLDGAFARTALAARDALLRAKATVPAVFRLSLLHAQASWLAAQPPAADPIITGHVEDIDLVLQSVLGS